MKSAAIIGYRWPQVGVLPITPEPDGRTFQVDRDGEHAAILEVQDRHGETRDFVAWLESEPSEWWLFLGEQVPVLGARALAYAIDHSESIGLYSTPRQWLASGGLGACVLQWDADLHPLFIDVPRVLTDHPELGARLRRVLRAREPKIAAASAKETRRANR